MQGIDLLKEYLTLNGWRDFFLKAGELWGTSTSGVLEKAPRFDENANLAIAEITKLCGGNWKFGQQKPSGKSVVWGTPTNWLIREGTVCGVSDGCTGSWEEFCEAILKALIAAKERNQ